MMMKFVLVLLVTILIALQAKAWFSNVGHFAAVDLKEEVQQQAGRAKRVAAANEALVAQVLALRSGTAAIESSARTDLGMIKQGEEYYVVAMPQDESASTQRSQQSAGARLP